MSNDDDPSDGSGNDFGAPWWRERLGLSWFSRRSVSLGLLGSAAMAAGGCAEVDARPDPELTQLADEVERKVDALELQRAEGWSVGGENLLTFSGSSVTDASGGEGWRTNLQTLAAALAPSRPGLKPWYVPTLFQSLIGPQAVMLRAVVRPVHTPEMSDAYGKGLAVRDLFEQAGAPKDTAIVVDVPGPRAVAIATALADRYEPVFTFGNWPHPDGVVRSQETLAATVYFRPCLERAAAARAADAPPVFVLDADRLAPYVDATGAFDNRYTVRLPDPAQLAALGIKHVLYVTEDGAAERDDLVQPFVDLQRGGVDVKGLALADFVRDDEAAQLTDEDEALPPDYWAWTFALALQPCVFFYGGDIAWHASFWNDYGWYPCPHGTIVGPPGARRAVTVGPPSGTRPPVRGLAWAPSVRPTLLSAHAVSIGQVPIRAARADGTFIGVSHSVSYYYGGGGGRSFGYGGGGGHSFGHFGGGGGVRTLGAHSFGGFGGFGRSGSFGRGGGGFGG